MEERSKLDVIRAVEEDRSLVNGHALFQSPDAGFLYIVLSRASEYSRKLLIACSLALRPST
jgi:hypothetical protein